MFSWIETTKKKLFGVPSRPARRIERRSTRLSLGVLEDRTAPATLTVTNLSGDPAVAGSLPNEVAQANAQNNTVVFAPNLSGVIPLSAVIEVGANQSGVTIDGSGANITISGQNETRIFQVDPSVGLTLNNLILTYGLAPQAANSDGGALLALSGAQVNLNNDTFSDNSAVENNQDIVANGAAIENDGSTKIINCNFTNNTADGNGGAIENFGRLQIQDGTFSNNKATRGGAIDSAGDGNGSLTLQGVTFQQNTAQGGNGGAIATIDPATLSNNNQFLTNKAVKSNGAGGSGGAIYSYASAFQTMQDSNSTYSGNTADVNGGAIDTANNTTLTSDTFSLNNSAGNNGGAIINEASNQLKITASNFDSCMAGGNGGAIENVGSLIVLASGSAASTFSNNTATDNGGAIDSNNGTVNGQLSVSNSSFWGNSAQTGTGGAINTRDNTNLLTVA